MTPMSDRAELRRLAKAAIDSMLGHYSGDVAIDVDTFYRPVLDLLAEIERLRTVIQEAVSDLAGGANFYCVCPEVMDRLSAALPPTPEALEYLQTLKEKDD